jgi:1-acyl-sn-glycerol-3-phosphate acyltransferase
MPSHLPLSDPDEPSRSTRRHLMTPVEPKKPSFFDYRRRVPGKGTLSAIWFDISWAAVELTLRLLYRMTIVGRERVPPRGPVLFISNHQSFLDPVVNGCAVIDRQLSAIARESLFRFPLGQFLRSIRCIPIKDDGGDAAAIRAALGELAAGRCVMIYPEGSRCRDGRVEEFKRGMMVLIRRAKVPVLLMAVDGTFDVWPKGRKFPALHGRIGVIVGDTIAYEDLVRDDADVVIRRLERDVDRLRLEIRRRLRERTHGRRPLPGPGDEPSFPPLQTSEGTTS